MGAWGFSLPMRDGNLDEYRRLFFDGIGFSLPMRDGNKDTEKAIRNLLTGFSLPMRDGNVQEAQQVAEVPVVLAYL